MLSEEELKENFSKLKPKMTRSEARIESSRCLFCHDAPCTVACPSDIDVPMFIRQIMSGNDKGAARVIFSQNILGKSCASVCPTEVLCEGSCVYLDLNEKPIDIGRLQGYATDFAIKNKAHYIQKKATTGKKIALIGAGPAGLACAHELTLKGHNAVIYEASPKAGGLNAYGVAPYKFSNTEAQEEVDYIQSIGFEIKTGCRVTTKDEPALDDDSGKTILLETLLNEYDALFLGVGLGASKQLGLKGEDKKNVMGAAEFIYHLRKKEQKIPVGKQVVIVGGGNTAIDACVEAVKLGAERVTLVYRRSEEEQSAYDFEVDLARLEGVQFCYLTSPLEVLGDSAVEGLRCIRNVLTLEQEQSGKQGIKPLKGSEFTLPCDFLILATGQEKMTRFFQSFSGLELENGKVKVNASYQTSCPSIFAGGDCVNGGKEVVNAVAHGRDAARGLDQYLMNGVNE